MPVFQNLQALAELAKAGYKPSDIKELLELDTLKEKPGAESNGGSDDKTDEKKETEKTKEPAEDDDILGAIIKRNEEN